MPTPSLAEYMITTKLNNFDPDDFDVRVFRDLDGEVSFASLEDVHIEPTSDSRVALITKLANEYTWPSISTFPEEIEGYEGSINELTKKVLTKMFPGLG